jgi:DNA repair ATPase RecN
MTMTDEERKEYDQKLDALKHSLKRFINVNLQEMAHKNEKDTSHIDKHLDEMKTMMDKIYYQAVDSHAEIQVLKTKYEFMVNVMAEVRETENETEKALASYKRKMSFYEFLIDQKFKVLLSIPVLVGFYQALKEPIKQYFVELIKLWK